MSVIGLIYRDVREARGLVESPIKISATGIKRQAIFLPSRKLNRRGQRRIDPGSGRADHILTGQEQTCIGPKGDFSPRIMAEMSDQHIGVRRESIAQSVVATTETGVTNIAENGVGPRAASQAVQRNSAGEITD